MNIAGIDKAKILAALYNASGQKGTRLFSQVKEMTLEEAQELLKERMVFDVIGDRILKIDLSESELDTSGFNHVNGKGAAESILEPLR